MPFRHFSSIGLTLYPSSMNNIHPILSLSPYSRQAIYIGKPKSQTLILMFNWIERLYRCTPTKIIIHIILSPFNWSNLVKYLIIINNNKFASDNKPYSVSWHILFSNDTHIADYNHYFIIILMLHWCNHENHFHPRNYL